MLHLHVLPAGHGDCLWLEYGTPGDVHRVLVDGGTAGTARLLAARIDALPERERRFELLVVTHVDADHIAGVLKLHEAALPGLSFADTWFNGYRHLQPARVADAPGAEVFGPLQGEELTRRLVQQAAPWNAAFGGAAVQVPSSGALPVKHLRGGLTLTLLGPRASELQALAPTWEADCAAAGREPGLIESPHPSDVEVFGGEPDVATLAAVPFQEDTAPANGTSIALLAEYAGQRLLLTGDAHPSTLLAALDRLVAPGDRLNVAALKLPHHGSRANVSRALLERVACQRYVFSTNGAYFKHPDDVAVARVIAHGGRRPELIFNYESERTRVWRSPGLRAAHGYDVRFLEPGEPLVLA
jgi:beta-lactamase superfamily II metal-dependent hydrolase